jgi:hypothetical protein
VCETIDNVLIAFEAAIQALHDGPKSYAYTLVNDVDGNNRVSPDDDTEQGYRLRLSVCEASRPAYFAVMEAVKQYLPRVLRASSHHVGVPRFTLSRQLFDTAVEVLTGLDDPFYNNVKERRDEIIEALQPFFDNTSSSAAA